MCWARAVKSIRWIDVSPERRPLPHLLSLLAALVLAGTWGSLPARADIFVDLGRGPVQVHVPSSYNPSKPAPLVLLLHGYGQGGASNLELTFDVGPLSEPMGFLYAYPQGTTNSAGAYFWNATDACCDFNGSGVDDSGYLRRLIDTIKIQLVVDEGRVYVIGVSNGGFMAYRMACDHSDAIAGIVSIKGMTFGDPTACVPVEPVNVLHIHGTRDRTIKYWGGTLPILDPYPGAVRSVQTWASYSGCSLVPNTSLPPLDLDLRIPGAETTIMRFGDQCAPGGTAELWTVVDGEHGFYAPTPDLPELLMEHLLAHPKPGYPATYCTAKVNSQGCTPAITWSGTPSASSGSPFLVEAQNLVPASVGLLFYSTSGPQAAPFQGGYLCVESPLFRTPPASSGGSGPCSGSLSIDFNAHIASGAHPALKAGASFWGQYWSRDVASPSATSLTDAIMATIGL